MAAVLMLKHPLVSVAAGAAAMALDSAGATLGAAERLPVVGPWVRRGVSSLSQRGDRWIAHNIEPVKSVVVPVVVQLVELILEEIDLTALVKKRVDLDAVVAEVDVEAVINRIDLIALADKVIDGVDLPRIIRESTSSVTAEVMADVRTQGERADDVVAGIVDRVLGRDRDRQ
jgi:hypothetical protein